MDTIDGPIPIEELVGKTGKVYCYDIKRNRGTISTFKKVRKTGKNVDVYELILQDGTYIKMTSDHLLYTQRGWVPLKQLKNNDEILKINP
nr:Hint domain-containing protein [Anaerobutyricum hallii]